MLLIVWSNAIHFRKQTMDLAAERGLKILRIKELSALKVKSECQAEDRTFEKLGIGIENP